MPNQRLMRILLLAAVAFAGCASHARFSGVAGVWQAPPSKQQWIRLADLKVDLKREQLRPAIQMLMDQPMVELTQQQAADMAAQPLPLGGTPHWMLVRALGRPEQGFHHHTFITPDGLQLWISGLVLHDAPKEPGLYALIVPMARLPERLYVSVSEGE